MLCKVAGNEYLHMVSTMQLWAHAHGYITLYRTGRFDMDKKQFRALNHRAVRLIEGLAKADGLS